MGEPYEDTKAANKNHEGQKEESAVAFESVCYCIATCRKSASHFSNKSLALRNKSHLGQQIPALKEIITPPGNKDIAQEGQSVMFF